MKEYCEKVGLGGLIPVNEAEQYLNASPPLLKNMSPEECGIASILIARAASYIQLEINRIKADIRWCEKYITFIVASTIHEMGSTYTPYEYKRSIAINNNDVAKELETILNNAHLKVDAMEFMPQYLKVEAQMFAELQQTKKHQKV